MILLILLSSSHGSRTSCLDSAACLYLPKRINNFEAIKLESVCIYLPFDMENISFTDSTLYYIGIS